MMTLGLRSKLLIGNLALYGIMAVLFAIYVPAQQEEAAEEAFHLHAVSSARIIASLAETSVSNEAEGGQAALKEDLRVVGMTDTDIVSLAVLRPDNSVLAEYRASSFKNEELVLKTAKRPQTWSKGNYLHASQPVTHGGKLVGTVVIVLSKSKIAEQAATSRSQALLLDLVILVIGVFLTLLIVQSVTKPVLRVASSLDSVSSELSANAREQEASSAEEAAVVAETRLSMEVLLDSAQQIATQSSEVLGNAERTASVSQQVAARFAELAQMTDKVAEILATIMKIADRADLLALNASLEGTRAGEAGKGFTLVASEMRRLAENIMDSVSGIRTLMTEMREASQGAVEASDSSRSSSVETAESARRIAMLTQEQRQATEQVMASMDEMNNVLRETIEGVQRSTSVSKDLIDLSHNLANLVTPDEGNKQAETSATK